MCLIYILELRATQIENPSLLWKCLSLFTQYGVEYTNISASSRISIHEEANILV